MLGRSTNVMEAAMAQILVLVLLGICLVVAVATLLFGTILFLEQEEDEEADFKKMTRKAKWILSCMFLASSATVFLSYQFLAAYNPALLGVLVVWYVIGLLSRLALLVWRHELFSPIFANSEGEVMALFFYAVGGPFVTAHMVYEIIRHKGDPLYFINKMHDGHS